MISNITKITQNQGLGTVDTHPSCHSNATLYRRLQLQLKRLAFKDVMLSGLALHVMYCIRMRNFIILYTTFCFTPLAPCIPFKVLILNIFNFVYI